MSTESSWWRNLLRYCRRKVILYYSTPKGIHCATTFFFIFLPHPPFLIYTWSNTTQKKHIPLFYLTVKIRWFQSLLLFHRNWLVIFKRQLNISTFFFTVIIHFLFHLYQSKDKLKRKDYMIISYQLFVKVALLRQS